MGSRAPARCCRSWGSGHPRTALLLAGDGAAAGGAGMDVLDGRIARRREASPLGQEMDSLADVVSFGVAPATWASPSACRAGGTRCAWSTSSAAESAGSRATTPPRPSSPTRAARSPTSRGCRSLRALLVTAAGGAGRGAAVGRRPPLRSSGWAGALHPLAALRASRQRDDQQDAADPEALSARAEASERRDLRVTLQPEGEHRRGDRAGLARPRGAPARRAPSRARCEGTGSGRARARLARTRRRRPGAPRSRSSASACARSGASASSARPSAGAAKIRDSKPSRAFRFARARARQLLAHPAGAGNREEHRREDHRETVRSRADAPASEIRVFISNIGTIQNGAAG